MMAGFLQRLVASGARTLGEFSASARPTAKSSDALIEIVDEQVVAGAEVEAETSSALEASLRLGQETAPLEEQARVPQASMSPPTPREATAAVEVEASARPSREERRTTGLHGAPERTPVPPASRERGPATSRVAPLRDADIRFTEPGGAPSVPRPGSGVAGARVEVTGEATGSAPDATAPLKERWRNLAQRLRMNHPPPLPEAVNTEEAPPSPPARRMPPHGRQEEAQPPRGSLPRNGAMPPPVESAAPSLAMAEPPRRQPVPLEAVNVPPRSQAVPPREAGAQPPGRAPELVIGSLEVRIMSTPPALEPRGTRPEPRSSPSGSWQTAARNYLGRL